MTTVLLHVDHNGKRTVLSFDALPIRIGRDTSNDCRLEFPFVSRAHATIDLRDGRLALRDEHSRQGTWTHDGTNRLRPGRWEDLDAVGGVFRIGAVDIRVEAEPPARASAPPSVEDPPVATRVAAPAAPDFPTASASLELAAVLEMLDPQAIERAVPVGDGPERIGALWTEFVRRYARCRDTLKEAGRPPDDRPSRGASARRRG